MTIPKYSLDFVWKNTDHDGIGFPCDSKGNIHWNQMSEVNKDLCERIVNGDLKDQVFKVGVSKIKILYSSNCDTTKDFDFNGWY